VPPFRLPAAIALLRQNAGRSRLAASRMTPSPARAAVERIAARWEIMAEAEARFARRLAPANDD
jgi:hypothetical protein